jgi:hypothetical protein
VQLGTHFVPGLFAQLYWHWGLPAEGPLGIVVESEVWGVPETRVELDGAAITRAAAEAEVLWEAEDSGSAMTPGPFPQFMPRATFTPEPIPTGAVPDDEEEARRAIEAAFAGLGAVENGELVNVETGRELAPTMAMVQQRFGGTAGTATQTVDRIAFSVRPRPACGFRCGWEAGCNSCRRREAGPFLDADRWKVSRDTLCGVLARAGVPCPGS